MNWFEILNTIFGFFSFLFIAGHVIVILYKWYHQKRNEQQEQETVREFQNAVDNVVQRMNGYADLNLQHVTNIVAAAKPRWQAEKRQLIRDQIGVSQGVGKKILELLNDSPRSSFA